MFNLDTGTQMLILFAVLLTIRVPVAFSLGLSSLFAMWQMGFGLDLVGDLLASGITKFSLLAIPFFILAGILMGTAGMADRMIRFFRVLIGSTPGGMGVVGTVVCLFWGAVSGSGPASVAAIGPMIIKGMVEDGYPKPYAAGLVCTGAALSIVIPPSIGLVIYGVIAETSISKLFLAAILPGLFMGLIILGSDDAPVMFKAVFLGVPSFMLFFGFFLLWLGRRKAPEVEENILSSKRAKSI